MTLNEKTYCVYPLASRRNGTLYVGVTSTLPRCVWEHKEGIIEGFTKQYGVKLLVYYKPIPTCETPSSARRKSRNGRVGGTRPDPSMNPDWRDLYEDFA